MQKDKDAEAGTLRDRRTRRGVAGVSIEPWRSVLATLEIFVGGLDVVSLLELAAEVGRIHCAIQDGLIHLAHLSQREFFSEEMISDAAVRHLVPQPPQRILNDLLVIEGQLAYSVRPEPPHVLGFSRQFSLIGLHHGPIHNGNNPLTRRTVQTPKGI